MLALLPEISRQIPTVAIGFYLGNCTAKFPLGRTLWALRRGPWRIWHARRNNEMLVGLFLRYALRFPLILLWTSAAQRRHTWLTRFCYRRMDGLIATTEKAASFLDRPAQVIYHGVDTDVYHPPVDRQAERGRKGLPHRFNLGVFGRVRPQKGTGDLVTALIQVLPRHPDWGVAIIGQTTGKDRPFETELRENLRRAQLEDRVRWVGFIPDFQAIPSWYRALDLVVCASREEGFGVTCLEAMASSCPVVATTAGAWPELITEGEDGWIARAGDPDDLARALENALSSDAPSLARMGARARVTASQFAITREAAGIVRVYRELLARREGVTDNMKIAH